jgi:hypothetical protein
VVIALLLLLIRASGAPLVQALSGPTVRLADLLFSRGPQAADHLAGLKGHFRRRTDSLNVLTWTSRRPCAWYSLSRDLITPRIEPEEVVGDLDALAQQELDNQQAVWLLDRPVVDQP